MSCYACWDLKFVEVVFSQVCLCVHRCSLHAVHCVHASQSRFPLLLRASHGNVQPTEVFPGACSWLPAAYSSAGPGAGVAAAGYLPAVPASLDVRYEHFAPCCCCCTSFKIVTS